MGGANTQYKKFPTQHPFVANADGSSSNIKLGGFGFGDKQYVIPTMVDGKQLTNEEAIKIARQFGLDKYPAFNTVEQADEWAGKYHSKVLPDGTIKY